MASSWPPPPPPSPLLDLEITILSANHLKNVNWRHGDLIPYAVASLFPSRSATASTATSATTKPVWNELLSLPFTLPYPPSPLSLTIDIFHSDTPNPLLVGTARITLEHDNLAASSITTLELRRPSGRPQGTVRCLLALRERPSDPNSHHFPPRSSYYYSSAPPLPLQYPYGTRYSDPYAAVPAQAWWHYDRAYRYGGPSAPVGYSPGTSRYEQKQKGGRMEMGAGSVAGVDGGSAQPYYDSAYGYGGSAPVDCLSGPSWYEQKQMSARMEMRTALAGGQVAGTYDHAYGDGDPSARAVDEQKQKSGRMETAASLAIGSVAGAAALGPFCDRAYGYGGPSAPVDYSSSPSLYEQKPKGGGMEMGVGSVAGAGALGASTRLYYDRAYGYGGPSAPVDYYSGPSSYDQMLKGGRVEMGVGSAVGSLAGVFGELALEEGLKHEEDRITGRGERDAPARDDYRRCRRNYRTVADGLGVGGEVASQREWNGMQGHTF